MRPGRNMQIKQIKRSDSLVLILICFSSIALVTSRASTAYQNSANFQPQQNNSQPSAPVPAKPLPPPVRWLGLIGEYGPDDDILIILEKDGKLWASFKRAEPEPLDEINRNVFKFRSPGPHKLQQLIFERNRSGRATQVELEHVVLKRRQIEPESGNQLRVKPLRPVLELMKEARAAQPPPERGEFREADLVELAKLDPTIRLEIRYATTNNFLGTVFYSEARAFMQRPAAEAVVRANRKLKALGYSLLVHDAYRPWYVTNDLKTKKPLEMVSTYDETTDRAYPDYPGGTSLQRWHRKLLREAMEAEGFTVYEAEWWHFDYKDWQKYRIGNVTFEQIGK